MSMVQNTLEVGEARHLESLERAVSVALSPLDYAHPTLWGDALTAALCNMAQSSGGAILLPDRSPRWLSVILVDSHDLDAVRGLHEEITERLHEPGTVDLVLWARDDLAAHGVPSVPAAATDTVGIRVRTATGAVAAVCVYRDRALGPAPYDLLVAFRAIAPAFRSGVAAWLESIAIRGSVARMLDSLADPAMLFSVAGELLHANSAVERLAQSVDTARLRGEAQQVAWTVAAARGRSRSRVAASSDSGDAWAEAHTVRTIRIGGTVYRLRGSVVGERLVGAEPAVLVTMTASAAQPLSDDALRMAYGLTAREIQVARLIAEGLSNNEIAGRLGVRFFTARNHVERALSKLHVTTRHRVGPLLRNASPSESGRGHASAA